MSGRLARLALALYPLAWRRRYGEEMAALVEDSGASPRLVADLARGAVRAHLRPGRAAADALTGADRLRLGVSAVLLCWVVFAAAGLALYKTTEGRPFEGAGAPGLLGGLHLAIEALAVLASAAMLVGAAPLVLAAWRRRRTSPRARRAIQRGLGAVAVGVAATAALVAIAAAAPGLATGVEAAILAGWSLLVLGCGLTCSLAARRGLFAIDASPPALRLAGACATLVAAAMVAIALLVGLYLVDLIAAAPALASRPNGPLGLPDAAVSLAIQLAVMLAVAAPATLAAARAWRGAAGG